MIENTNPPEPGTLEARAGRPRLADRPWSSPLLAGGAMVLGGVAFVVASFLVWFEVKEVDGSVQLKGTDYGTGQGWLLFALLVGAFGIVMLARARKTGARGWSITALVFAAIIFGASGIAVVAPEPSIAEFVSQEVADEANVSQALARGWISESFASGTSSGSARAGAYAGLAAATLALGGAVLGTVKARRYRRGGPDPLEHPVASTAHAPVDDVGGNDN